MKTRDKSNEARGCLPVPSREESVLHRKRKRSFLVAFSVLCYVIALALLYKYSTLEDASLKEGSCDADEARPKRKNPLIQILQDASPFEHVKRKRAEKRDKAAAAQKRIKLQPSPSKPKYIYFPEAHSMQPDLSADQLNALREFSARVLHAIPDLHSRTKAVGWGGSQAWWTAHSKGSDIDEIDGGRLLWHYYKIMIRYMKDPLHLADSVHFPFKLCKSGCSAERAIQHSLEWREKYQPWRVSPAMLRENENGWVYHRGFSAVVGDSKNKHYGRHAMLWVRPGKHRVKDSLTYSRCIINAADRAVGEALHESHGRVGKFNVIVDCSNCEWSKLPDFQHVKQTVTMLQDHYTNRLGMIVVTNLSRPAEIGLSLIKPIITKEVRNKIHILSHDPERRAVELASFVEPEFLPDWLGGPDTHHFDASHYYQKRFYWSDTESAEFLTSMPYHGVS